MWYIAAMALSIGFGLSLAALAGAFGQSRAVSSALEGMARQPEAAGQIQTAMIIGLAFIESLVIYVLVIAFLLNGKIPAVDTIAAVMEKAH
ncbi:MAG: ATP synthase F0 subunit C [Planctomycetes bacterium]|nr:ATP synthase F0 subunit C [Planctomycetota bacterium]